MDFSKSRLTQPKQKNHPQNAILYTASYLLSELITYPLESLKTRFQMSGAQNAAKNFNTIRETLSETIKNRGVRGLYTGLGTSVTREGLFHLARFYCYDEVKKFYLAGIDGSGFYRRVLALITASSLVLLPLNIMDTIRIKMLNSPLEKPSGRTFFKEYRKSNHTIFSGYAVNFLRNGLFVAADLFARDQSKLLLVSKGKYSADSSTSRVGSTIAGALLGSLASYPVDVVRTRYMSQLGNEDTIFKRSLTTFVYMIKEEGIFSLFKGFSIFALRNMMLSFACMTIYENTKSIIL